MTSSALLSGSKRGDLEGRRQACSRSALSGHFEITEGEQMEKQPQMNIHEKKINYPPYVPPALSTELSPHLWGGRGPYTRIAAFTLKASAGVRGSDAEPGFLAGAT